MRRVVALVLFASMLLCASGCSVLFEGEYTSRRPYQAESAAEAVSEAAAPVSSITNYASLKQAILQLVSERVESAELQFQNYDGSIAQDISAACWEVKSSTALGAFAVDYISYDLSRIVSFYQAEIHITYKRSADQIASVESIYAMSALSGRLSQALRENRTYLALEATVASVTEETVLRAVTDAYYADPLACPVLPTVDVNIFPESGVTRILEITLGYDRDGETLAVMREELSLAVSAMTAAAVPESAASGEMTDPVTGVVALSQWLMENCRRDETAGSTAWDALVGGAADSEGLAMALKAGCEALGVECVVVLGRLDGVDHAWNMVFADGQPYHVDLAAEESVFMAGDDSLWGRWWWDTGVYPACPEAYGAATESPSSLEPAA